MKAQKKTRDRKPTPNGTRFGRLVVIGQGPLDIRKNCTARRYWCKCDCGKTKLIASASLRGGKSRSCGCLRAEQLAAQEYKHGHTSGDKWSQEYRAWKNMRRRCSKPSAWEYHRYGGRGIKVCVRWQKSFLYFIKDMGDKPSPKHSLERRDNNGNYRPSNCYWALPTEQVRNKSTNRLIAFNGKTKPLCDWAIETGIKSGTIGMRLKRGWSVKAALKTPAIVGGKYFHKKLT